jgi:hypothetical protein
LDVFIKSSIELRTFFAVVSIAATTSGPNSFVATFLRASSPGLKISSTIESQTTLALEERKFQILDRPFLTTSVHPIY